MAISLIPIGTMSIGIDSVTTAEVHCLVRIVASRRFEGVPVTSLHCFVRSVVVVVLHRLDVSLLLRRIESTEILINVEVSCSGVEFVPGGQGANRATLVGSENAETKDVACIDPAKSI